MEGFTQSEPSGRELTEQPADIAGRKGYVPGESASPKQVLHLAQQYRMAASVLLEMGERRRPLTWAPFRLAAIHAVELYLNALLLLSGLDPAEIRGLRHDLRVRKEAAEELGLIFRKRTGAHIVTLDLNREYLVTRYGPELASAMTQVNRLVATLDEVAEKVERRFAALTGAPTRVRAGSVIDGSSADITRTGSRNSGIAERIGCLGDLGAQHE